MNLSRTILHFKFCRRFRSLAKLRHQPAHKVSSLILLKPGPVIFLFISTTTKVAILKYHYLLSIRRMLLISHHFDPCIQPCAGEAPSRGAGREYLASAGETKTSPITDSLPEDDGVNSSFPPPCLWDFDCFDGRWPACGVLAVLGLIIQSILFAENNLPSHGHRNS